MVKKGLFKLIQLRINLSLIGRNSTHSIKISIMISRIKSRILARILLTKPEQNGTEKYLPLLR